ncbi:MAG: hypothetical protein A3H79_03160 [Candidatus Levybacteria bacterium RIFCSPLOWO2_02_FULL_36_8b]|nr:MAG: hypothetical protein A3H79_03160 [Candidatus Levybacteria bacterium RIFCSPLOWO2_02_FULL_36_8b]
MNSLNQLPVPPLLFYSLYTWSMIWKGIALWHASKYQQRNWFVAILVLQTAGILELVYLFLFAKEKLSISIILTWFSRRFSPKK